MFFSGLILALLYAHLSGAVPWNAMVHWDQTDALPTAIVPATSAPSAPSITQSSIPTTWLYSPHPVSETAAVPSLMSSAEPAAFQSESAVPNSMVVASSVYTSDVTKATSTGGSGSSNNYMEVVSAWRNKIGMNPLSEDSQLEANAQKTVNDDQGVMNHELNPGSMAQVLAQGNLNNFENVFVGGWLCEEPSASGMDGICSTMSAGWDYDGQTGHAEILRNPNYKQIGCAFADGLWGCDLA